MPIWEAKVKRRHPLGLVGGLGEPPAREAVEERLVDAKRRQSPVSLARFRSPGIAGKSSEALASAPM